jgi:2,4-dienoyl-CoA reductase-like NADH-dependent reductase (Old Yellow Enzyme family)/thioredoxin reductase
MNLLKPITIRGVEFKNRMAMPPMQVGLGMRSARARAYYLERAKGGVGTIIVAGTSVDVFATDDAWGRPGGIDAFLDGIRPLIDDVHQTGARIGIQLWHGNQFPAGTGTPQDMRGEPVAPSASAERRQLTIPEIKVIISRFAQATANAQRAGFDFVEIHGAHGYLVCQFFSPATNRRDDEYGGDFARRMRFGTECVSAMRAAVSDDYPIFYRLGAWEDVAGGITLDDSAQFAAELEKAGADVIDVSLGGMFGPGVTASPGPEQPEGTFVPLAEAIKRQVKVPVIAVGRFRTPQVAEDVLAQGKADMVAIGRQLIADPYWPEKVATGRTEDIIPCISCNACFETGFAGLGLRCSVNAATGREAEWAIVPASKPKKVMVVGGGPAGMEAARVAALRGHKVTLYERQSELGGQLVVAALPPHKQELALLNRYLAHQLDESAIRVKLGVEVTPELLVKDKPDALILAAGSTPLMPEIPGVTKDNVVTAMDVLSGRVDVGEKVVVIGGELVGCETADFLSQRGKKVTVVRRGPEMASKMFPINRHALLARLKENGVVLVTGVKKYEAITEDGLVMIDGRGKRRTLEADTIVLAAGAIPNDQLAKAAEGRVGQIYLAGDCVQPRRILDAIHDGARLGREV